MHFKNRCGFNLLTISVVVLMLGVLMSATLGLYNSNNAKKRIFETKKRFNKLNLALKNYVLKNKKFPCPAPLNCDDNECVSSTEEVGVENRNSAGNCVYDELGVFSSKNNNEEIILYGAVPFLTLGVANNYSIDTWGNKLVYMIPLSLTLDKSISDVLSAKTNNEDPEYLKNGLLYLIISFYKNQRGAYAYDSQRSNYFSNIENMPISNFTVNSNNSNYLYTSKNSYNFGADGLKEELQECPKLTYSLNIDGASIRCDDFEYAGEIQHFTVPNETSKVIFEIYGGAGVDSDLNIVKGDYAYGELTEINEGDIFNIDLGSSSEGANVETPGYNSEITKDSATVIIAVGGGSAGNDISVVDNGKIYTKINPGNGYARICYESTSLPPTLTFKKAKYGEIVFSEELCPNYVSNPPNKNNYYYMSTYIDENKIVIDNRAAKKCGKNGKWNDGFVYKCSLMNKCTQANIVFTPYSDWDEFDFDIVNTGVVQNVDHSLNRKCFVNNNGISWYAN